MFFPDQMNFILHEKTTTTKQQLWNSKTSYTSYLHIYATFNCDKKKLHSKKSMVMKIWSQKNMVAKKIFLFRCLLSSKINFGDHKNMVLNFMVNFSEKYGQPRPNFF